MEDVLVTAASDRSCYLWRLEADQPAEKGFVLDERHPVVGVIGALFHTELAQARLSAQQNHVRLGLGWHETQEENVGALA